MAKINFSPAALGDLRIIFDYIPTDSEFYAEKVISKILKAITVLKPTPGLARLCPNLKKIQSEK